MLLSLLTCAVSAAQSVVVPSSAAVRPPVPYGLSADLFFVDSSSSLPSASRLQALYDVNDVGVATATFRSLQVRRPAGLRGTSPALTTNLTVIVSVTPLPHASASSVFASNHGASPVTVFTNALSLPARTNPVAWPAPWEAAIPFAQPWSFARGAGTSLVVEFAQTATSGTGAWVVEAVRRDLGTRVDNGLPNCKFSTIGNSWALRYRTPYVNGSWFLSYEQLPANTPGLAAIGLQGNGAMWGGVPLPVDLGILGAPGCTWNVAPLVTVAMQSDGAGTAAWPTVPLANDPTLIGQSFYDHSVWMDAAANAAGLVTGWSSKWTIGDDLPVPATTVSVVGSATASSGNVSADLAPTLQLNQ